MTAHNRKSGDKRLVDMCAMPAGTGSAWTPDLPKVDTYEQVFSINATAQYVQRLDLDERNRPVEWVVIQMRLVAGRWRRVAVYDTCHQKGVHVHFYDRDENQFDEAVLWDVEGYDDLEQGLDYALKRVSESWRENERRSDRGF